MIDNVDTVPAPTSQNIGTTTSTEVVEANHTIIPNNSKYIVIAGSFLVPSNADKCIEKLKKFGYKKSEKMILPDSEFYSVVVGSFDEEMAAKNLMTELKSKKIDSFIKLNQ